MARVTCIHGIAQERESRETLLAEWAPALCGGVSNAKGHLDSSEVDMAFYGILFRPTGVSKSGGDIPNYKPGDLEAPFEQELVRDLHSGIPAPVSDPQTKAGERGIGYMAQALANAPYFGGVAQNVVIWMLKQVHRYLSEPRIRNEAQQSLLERITPDTRVVVSHSLGSIVAYETLCAHPELPVRALVTLGSPLGVPSILPRLMPPVSGRAHWPANLKAWVNVADATDVVALRKDLAGVYGDNVVDHLVHNGATMHNVKPYLTAAETGRAIIAGLA